MSMPRVPLPLPGAEPRCSSDSCPRTSLCARRRATVDAGSPMQDYTMLTHPWLAAACNGFVDLASLRAQAPAQPAQQAKPFPTGD